MKLNSSFLQKINVQDRNRRQKHFFFCFPFGQKQAKITLTFVSDIFFGLKSSETFRIMKVFKLCKFGLYIVLSLISCITLLWHVDRYPLFLNSIFRHVDWFAFGRIRMKWTKKHEIIKGEQQNTISSLLFSVISLVI